MGQRVAGAARGPVDWTGGPVASSLGAAVHQPGVMGGGVQTNVTVALGVSE